MIAARDESQNTPACNQPSSFPTDLPEHTVKRPELHVDIFGTTTSALLDSGASISAVSEHFYATLKSQSPTPSKLSTLPVTGVTISTAIQGRSKKITRQVYVPLSVFGQEAPGIFLVIPHLSTEMILGDDWLTQYGVVLNYLTQQVEFPKWDTVSPFRPQIEGIKSDLMTQISVHQDLDRIMPTAIEHCISDISFVKQVSTLPPSPCLPLNCFEHTQPVTDSPTKPWSECIVNFHEVPDEERSKLISLLDQYHNIFDDRPGLNTLYSCRFEVSEDVPFKVKPYPVPFSRRPAVEKELQRMLSWGVVERSSSPYCNPIVCVAKADGSVRLCLDARRVNRLILPMRDTSPPLDELLARFGGKTIFSSLDFSAGYWQVPLHPAVRKFTAFVFEGRTYQFCVVPFGLNISNTAFGKALEAVLNIRVNDTDDNLDDLHIYVDDVLISSTSFDEHLARLDILFQKISMAGMTLKLSKCEFLRHKIKFLGHIVTPLGMSMDPSKLQAIREFPQPRNKKELQSFIGFCNFYRKFSSHHATIISPLIELIKKDRTWRFGYEELKLFNAVRESFTEQYLSHPHFDQSFYLQTDASKVGLGAELFQISPSGDRRTISFASRTLNTAERNYSITELELLSIVFACEKFRVFILGYTVIVLTDHQALTFLFQCRLRNARLTRWTLHLQEFNLQVKHIPGSDNVIDALSRSPAGREEAENFRSRFPCILTITSKKVRAEFERQISSFKSICSSQREDTNLNRLHQLLMDPPSPQIPYLEHYSLVEGVLFYRRHKSTDQWLVCIPAGRVDEFITQVHHHFGHVGPKKCILAIRDFCFFKSFQSHIRKIVRSCVLCQKTKASTVRIEGKMQSVLADVPLGRVLVDLYGPLPPGWNQVRYIFVVLDNFSRFVRLYPVKRATAVTVTNRMIDDYISTYGKPQCVVSDHGVQFQSNVWQRRLLALGVPPTMISVYHPQSNPAERVMRELGRMFRTYCHENHFEWPRYVSYIEWVLNNTVHESTGYTPQELFLSIEQYNPLGNVVSFPIRFPLSQRTKLTMAREIQLTHSERRRRRHDKQGTPTSFAVGTLVLVKTHRLSSSVDKCIKKFFLLYEGPYVITGHSKDNAYTLADPDTYRNIGTYNVIHLRPFHEPINSPIHQNRVSASPQEP